MASFASFKCQQSRRCPQAGPRARSAVVKAQDSGAARFSSFLLAGAAAASLLTASPAGAVSPNIIDNIKDFTNNPAEGPGGGPARVGERMGERLQNNEQIQQIREAVTAPRPSGGGSQLEEEKSEIANPMERVKQKGVSRAVAGRPMEVAQVADLAKVSDRSGPSAVTDLNEARNFKPNESETGQYVMGNTTGQKAPEVPTEGVQAGLPETLEPRLTDGNGGFKPVFLNEENMYDLKDKNEEAAFYQSDKQSKSDEDNIVDKVAAIESPSTTERFGSDGAAGKGVEESQGDKRFY